MVDSIMKVLTFVVVVILVLLLLDLVGPWIGDELAPAGGQIRHIFEGAWDGIQKIIQPGYGRGH
jgi:hypothetical protein